MSRKRAGGPDGFVVVDKEAGWTSHDVVARTRRLLDTRKVGHSGTLDPPATGVLVLGVGRGTRLLRFITELPKVYEATMVLGVETTTLDADGDLVATHDMSTIGPDDVEAAAAGFVGEIDQIPPMVSAVKVGGRRLHQLAREGTTVEREPRRVVVHSIDIDPTDRADVYRLVVECGSGTYVRSLVADIGAALGGGAHVGSLRRLSVGSFAERDAHPVDDPHLIPLAEGLRDRGRIVATEEVAASVGHGRPLARAELGLAPHDAGPWAVVDAEGNLLAVYERRDESTVKPAVVVAPASD